MDDPDKRVVVDFVRCYGATTMFWRVTLHPCGHKAKVPEHDERKVFPPTHATCKKCRMKRLKGIK